MGLFVEGGGVEGEGDEVAMDCSLAFGVRVVADDGKHFAEGWRSNY